MLSIATDYKESRGEVAGVLKNISEAGFTHIHWCHHWNTDFAYMDCEIEYIKGLLQQFNLKLLDLHGSTGPERDWQALEEHNRVAGVELVKNRISMTARLGGDCVVMHAKPPSKDPGEIRAWMQQLKKSLDELEGFCRDRGVRIALENLNRRHFREVILPLLDAYSDEYIGVCYDSGHDNFACEEGPTSFEELRLAGERVISLHLHDNDGSGDQHRLPFTGTFDWEKFTGILKEIGYSKVLNLEVGMGDSFHDELAFLEKAWEAGNRLLDMITG